MPSSEISFHHQQQVTADSLNITSSSSSQPSPTHLILAASANSSCHQPYTSDIRSSYLDYLSFATNSQNLSTDAVFVSSSPPNVPITAAVTS